MIVPTRCSLSCLVSRLLFFSFSMLTFHKLFYSLIVLIEQQLIPGAITQTLSILFIAMDNMNTIVCMYCIRGCLVYVRSPHLIFIDKNSILNIYRARCCIDKRHHPPQSFSSQFISLSPLQFFFHPFSCSLNFF